MPQLIESPTRIESAGNLPKRIEEYAGRVNSGHATVSVARMVSPSGWVEPGQCPEFEEITVVLRGSLRVEHEDGEMEVAAGQAVVTSPGEWVRCASGRPGAANRAAPLPRRVAVRSEGANVALVPAVHGYGDPPGGPSGE